MLYGVAFSTVHANILSLLYSRLFSTTIDAVILNSYQHPTLGTSGASASSLTSSPSFVHRDSILKRVGSAKGDQKKNVSIVTAPDQLPSVEVISERKRMNGKI